MGDQSTHLLVSTLPRGEVLTRPFAPLSHIRCSPDGSSGEPSRTLCQRFARVSPDLSGHRCQTDGAPMLVETPLPVILSVFGALGPPLWIRRVSFSLPFDPEASQRP